MTPPSRARRKVRMKMWGGFSDGKLCHELEHYTGAKVAAIFFTRKAARSMYHDYRPVLVTYPAPPSKKKKRVKARSHA